MSTPPLNRHRRLIQKQVKEIVQNHKQCMHLISARFRTIFFLTLVFSLLEANKMVMGVCSFYASLTNDKLKETEELWYFDYGKYLIFIIPHFPAGRLAELYGGKWILFVSVAGSGMCLFLMPIALDTMKSVLGLHMLNVIEFFFVGFALPAIQAMLARWSIPSERILMASIVFSSYALGKSVGVMLSVWLCSVFGWQAAFYVFASLCVILLILWAIFVHDDYEDPRARISVKEREVMVREMNGELYNYKDKKLSRLPLKEILQCRPLWSVLVAHMTLRFCEAQYSTPVQENLARMKLGVDHNTNTSSIGPINYAVIIALPYFWTAVLSWILGLVFFNLVSGRMITKRGAYRVGCAISILGITVTAILKLLDQGRSSGRVNILYDQIVMSTLAGFLSTSHAPYLDMAPNYAGTTMAFHNIISAIPRHLVYITFDHVKVVNYIGYALLLIVVMMSVFFYPFYVTDELMDWNNFPLGKKSQFSRPIFLCGRRKIDKEDPKIDHSRHSLRRHPSGHPQRHIGLPLEPLAINEVTDPGVQSSIVPGPPGSPPGPPSSPPPGLIEHPLGRNDNIDESTATAPPSKPTETP